MRGIVAYGAYVPCARLDRATVAAALGTPASSGFRSVASFDEDSTTLGVEAARIALTHRRTASLDALLFATATPAYLDKTNAAAIHAALGLPRDVLALDSGGALRSGLGSLILGLDGGSASLVVMSDVRAGRPGSDEEVQGGDAAAAFVVGDGSDVVAELLSSASATEEVMDRWRLPGATTSESWEERFAEQIYVRLAEEVLGAALKKANLLAEDVTSILVTGTHARAVKATQRLLGGSVLADLSTVIGQSGTAHAGLLLTLVLDSAASGDVIAVVSLADGCDVTIFRATHALETQRSANPLARQLEAPTRALDYPTFLTWRGFLEREPPRRPDPVRPAGPPAFRGRRWKFGLTGSIDRSSGAVHLPPQRVSYVGEHVDDMEAVRLMDTRGKIATFTVDRLAYTPSPPMIVAVIDFDEGGRITAELTDASPDEVSIGAPVEMTFRRLHTAGAIHNYFWKARLVRATGEGY